MMRRIGILGILLPAMAALPAAQPVQSGAAISIIPQPVRLVRHEGAFVLSPRTAIHVSVGTGGKPLPVRGDAGTLILKKTDFANPAQMNHFDWYEAHDWAKPYPGETRIVAPADVPGAALPAPDRDS